LLVFSFIFDEHLTFSDQISTLSKSCYSHNRQYRCINPYINSKTVSIIAASIVHSKFDCCNSLYYNLNRLNRIENSLVYVVVKALKFTHTTPIPKSLHWLKISERIEYEILSLTFKLIYTTQPPYTCTTCSLSKLHVILDLHLMSLLLAHQLAPPQKITSRSGISSLTHFVSHVLIYIFLIYLFSTIISLHECHRRHFYYPSPYHSFFQHQNFYFSQILRIIDIWHLISWISGLLYCFCQFFSSFSYRYFLVFLSQASYLSHNHLIPGFLYVLKTIFSSIFSFFL